MKKKQAWAKQWFMIKTYNEKRVWFFSRNVFYVRATTHNTAVRELRKYWKEANVLCIVPMGGKQ